MHFHFCKIWKFEIGAGKNSGFSNISVVYYCYKITYGTSLQSSSAAECTLGSCLTSLVWEKHYKQH